jgi:hypothetical protein
MSSNEIIEQLVVDASTDPLNPEKNFNIALEYEKLGQTASAVGFYLRAAEYGYKTDPLTAYCALLKISICIEGQKNRDLTVSNVLLQAVAFLPDRPEAYFLLSRFYEKSGLWPESYAYAVMGTMYNRQFMDLPSDVGYYSWYSLNFQIAIAAWWVGRKEDSIELLTNIATDHRAPKLYRDAANENLDRLVSNVDV